MGLSSFLGIEVIGNGVISDCFFFAVEPILEEANIFQG